MKYFLSICIATTILLTGCQMGAEQPANGENEEQANLPDVPAFQSDFTRDFMASTEALESGDYVFVSATGRFKMNFPAQAAIQKKSYAEDSGTLETFLFIEEENDKESLTVMTFEATEGNDDMAARLRKVEEKFKPEDADGNFELELNFETYALKDKTLYMSPLNVGEESIAYVALMINDVLDNEIEIIYETACDADCDKEAVGRAFKDWLETIEFMNELGQTE